VTIAVVLLCCLVFLAIVPHLRTERHRRAQDVALILAGASFE
jgi:hypothetical protein